ncbi:hypothetical protein G6F22_005095 [Rhizopus arrhizus]|nr:hypothetical protein G6F22_005095 [Rhizopus arrhizus]
MLNGTIPDQLYSLTGLQILDLSNNRLTGQISSSIGNLVNLERLNLGHNSLTGLIPDQISQLTKLQSLSLNYNLLNGQFPSISAPPALGYCYMTPNQFQSCPDPSVTANPNSLAFQCSINCSVQDKKKSSANRVLVGYSTMSFVVIYSLGLFL